MTPRPKAEHGTTATSRAQQAARRWLLFVHQLPSNPSNLRVRTWRRLQQLGAIPIKQAVYVLPDTPGTREDFEWLRTEVKAAGGDASVFSADHVDAWSDDALVEEFRRSRQEAYASLARDVEKALKRPASAKASARQTTSGARRPRGTRAPAIRRLSEVFRERLTAIGAVDFFGSAGRDRVTTLLKQFEGRMADTNGPAATSRSPGPADASTYSGRLWVTRPRPGVDRMASAWLIRRFIDLRHVSALQRTGTRFPKTQFRSTCLASTSAITATAARSKPCAPCSASRRHHHATRGDRARP